MEYKLWTKKPTKLTSKYSSNQILLGDICDIGDYLTGIINIEELSPLHTEMGSLLNHATTIFEIDENSVSNLKDSNITDDKIRRSCKKFREYCGNQYCHSNDKAHASILIGMHRKEFEEASHLSERLRNELKTDCTIESIYYESLSGNVAIRYFMKYHCPFLGYLELLFPIFYNDIIIACMFIGQIKLEGDEITSSIEKMLYERIEKDPLFFINAEEGIEVKDIDNYNKRIIKEICESECNVGTNGNSKKIFNPIEYSLFKQNILIQLNDLERRLAFIMLEKRKILLKHLFLKKKEEMFKKIDKLNRHDIEADGQILKEFWGVLKFEMSEMFDILNIGNVYCFGNTTYKVDGPNTNILSLPFIFATNTSTKLACDLIGKSIKLKTKVLLEAKYPISIPNLNNIVKVKSIKNLRELESYLEGLTFVLESIDKNMTYHEDEWKMTNETLFWPAFDNNSSVLIYIEYEKTNNIVITEPEIHDFIIENLISLLSLVFSQFQSIWALISKGKVLEQKLFTENAFSIFGHEISQYTASLSRLYVNNFSNIEQIKQFLLEEPEEKDKPLRILNDLISSIESIEYISKNSKVYQGEVKPAKENFYVFEKSIFKFIAIFKAFNDEIKTKNIYVATPHLTKNDPLRGEIYSDPILLEQVIFNLLKNAFQYAHSDTQIYVDFKRDNENSPYKLTIKNYGIELDNSRDIYKMFVRGKNANENFLKGSGLGLYIVKKIIKALGGNIEESKSFISNYNVPLMKQYLEVVTSTKKNNPEIEKEIREELNKIHLIPEEVIVNPVINKHNYIYICEYITVPTWETVFTVTLPVK